MKVSLLIPVYNCLHYLPRAFDSFVNQTLEDMEIIFVDDCSIDGSFAWMKKAIEDSDNKLSLKLLRHDKNRGVAAARNTLLDAAIGEYTFFVDADDWLELDAMEKLCTEAERTGADIVSCDQMLHYADHTKFISLPLKKTGIDNIKAVWSGELVGGLSHVLVRRSLYKKVQASFIEGADYAEDLQAKIKLFLATDKYAYVSEAFYHYDQTNINSVSHKTSPHKIEGRLKNVVSMIQTLEQYPFEFSDLIRNLKIEARAHAIRLRYEFGNRDYDLSAIYPECSGWRAISNNKLSKRTQINFVLEKLGLGCIIKYI